MRKVIFEQTGNVILAILLTLATCQTILSSKLTIGSEAFSFNMRFGSMWFAFLGGVILFSFARFLYARKIGVEDGYNEKEGEMSAKDEREKLVGMKAAAITYRVMIYFLGVALVILFSTSMLLSSANALRLVSVVAVGGCLVLAFLTYLIAWVKLDNEI